MDLDDGYPRLIDLACRNPVWDCPMAVGAVLMITERIESAGRPRIASGTETAHPLRPALPPHAGASTGAGGSTL
jgi:hypothetical protein